MSNTSRSCALRTAATAAAGSGARQPSAEELREIRDTSRDTTIAKKVEQQRAQTDGDLLADVARRE